MTKRISILGSTGSIGTQTLDVVSHYPERFVVTALAGGNNVGLLAEQTVRFRPQLVSVATKELAAKLRELLPAEAAPRIVYGPEGLAEAAAATDADIIVTAVVGSQGLQPTLAAIEAGKTIALANKETLVSAGHLVTDLARRKGVSLLPVDSEHSAIFQCLNGEPRRALKRIVITASGGSFRDKSRTELHGVTVEQALRHPNWSMGAKITIDSATMANKGLEVMEARWLYDVSYDEIDVLIHPESIVHSFVEFADGSVIAQMGVPDMRVPIQYALTYPERLPTPVPRLDLAQLGKLHFREMDFARFRMMRLAYDAGRAGGTMPTVFNAANEVAVARFLRREIEFLHIDDIVERAMAAHTAEADPGLEAILAADAWARDHASRSI
ncbi:1-deoxy-D-xylulose 5-phosphate reductoisomerase [Gordoniibacillus kamchatkensis]|uniref:1-deoxy-D-xylulose 5-phosphate reductoisomerase n=1 Tax=Gordoniibacillus kamchatkensis TaxID=1590651 RepID=A0ABR5AEW9_9BACL|nr:1-deoxy-D-xylulose-5-phosphate reductoisomerase [Paenibacillus sp. VKM B-2647]KIL39213.1 1-deoxy-D-xylulose 5-phosphate reductoisomerase [Paenibacillus sp. VKM B-2647]